MRKLMLSTSTFYLHADRLGEEVESLSRAGVDSFHVDLMDGCFVQNLGMSFQDLDAVRRHTDRLVDVHMMVRAPGRYIQQIAEHGADIIIIHPEADDHPAATLELIRKQGCKSGIAVNPGTSLGAVEELFQLSDYVILMTVNPGFAGQTYLEYVESKIIRCAAMQELHDFMLMVDGGVTWRALERLIPYGVRGFVCGNQVLLEQRQTYQEIIKRIRSLAEKE